MLTRGQVLCFRTEACIRAVRNRWGGICFLYDPEQEDTTRAYRPDSFVMAVMMDDEIFDGKVLQYLVTLSYDGHVKGVEYLGLDDAGRPDAVDVE